MHLPDGFIDGPTSLAAGAIALGGMALCLRKAGRSVNEKQIPLVGLTAAFIFAAQMLNFPVAAGTSGHLMGATLAAVLVGPYLGAVSLTVVLVVQALLFADGGLSALGLNVINMSFVGAFGGYVVFLALRAVLPARPASISCAAGVAAWCSVVASAGLFSVEYVIGGATGVSGTSVATAMLSVHALIGIGEGFGTAFVVSAVLASRPDLVYGARSLPSPTVAATVPSAPALS